LNFDPKISDALAGEASRCCPLCGQSGFVPFLQKEKLRLVQCRNCAMIFANPVPAEMADGSFYNEIHAPFYLSPDKLKSDYASVRFERELKWFRRFCKSGNVLDVGCSTGAFLFQLQNRFPENYDALGTDVSQPALEYAQSRGVKIANQSFLDFDFGEKHFDAITFWAVMEHLTQPRDFLDKAASLLKPGGHCFILVPNMKSLAVRILRGKYRYIYPEHVNYFTPRTLRKFSETPTAFEIVASGSMHFNPIVIWQDGRGRGGFVSDERRAALLKRTTSYKENPLLQPLKWVYKGAEKILSSLNLADNLLIVLRKK